MRAAGFSFASELAVVAVARVDRVVRFDFSAAGSIGFSDSGSLDTFSLFFGRPRGFVVVTFFVSAGWSSVTGIEGFRFLVDRVTGCVDSSIGCVISFSKGVTFTRRRGAAASGAAADAEETVARVRGAMLKLLCYVFVVCCKSRTER